MYLIRNALTIIFDAIRFYSLFSLDFYAPLFPFVDWHQVLLIERVFHQKC